MKRNAKASISVIHRPGNGGKDHREQSPGHLEFYQLTNYELARIRPDVVESAHFSDSLLTLSCRISQREDMEEYP